LGKKTGNWISELKGGTWNIRTLYKPGATVELVREIERYRMKCVALQEVRLENAGTTKTSQTTIINGKSERGHKLGTGFAIHESIIHMIKEFKDVNPRISTLTLKDKNLHIVLINVHAPTEEKDEEIKEEFYDTLEEVFDTTVGNIKIVLGDLNAKIGKERIYHNVAGMHSLHEHLNDNGSRLANFASEKGLIIKSTMLPRKDIYKYTWVSPDGRHKNQIDHVLINNRLKNSITNVRTLRGADADSGHFLVGIWIRVKFKKRYRHKLNTIDRYDIEKLEEVNIQKDYDRKICETLKVQQITNTDDVNDVWIKIRNTVQQTAKTTIGIKEKRKKPWFNQICEDAVQRRKIAREEWLKDTNNEERTADFSRRRKEAHNIIRCEKRKYIQNIMKDAEQDFRLNRTRDMYKRINGIKGDFKKKERFLKDDDGMLITTE